jgi:putative ABC transport system permease protein
MIRRPMGLIVGGTVLGLAGTMASRATLSKLLFGVSATDPWTILAVVATLMAVALVSVFAPASRATRVDAARVLRAD